ncbi:hypothetical protein BDV36DRAFT_246813 [Aspergillus pseudocaelatus]|uniref:Secreted protein n=1 Tax=Aspergillus pseudocaelatus TaxID=1825620 RepID=A0ABQ6WXJ5_9EURO|nr:hypothetical protein BDV36DRAFT_246813 [Aspergillus pseudocaelatus]
MQYWLEHSGRSFGIRCIITGLMILYLGSTSVAQKLVGCVRSSRRCFVLNGRFIESLWHGYSLLIPLSPCTQISPHGFLMRLICSGMRR